MRNFIFFYLFLSLSLIVCSRPGRAASFSVERTDLSAIEVRLPSYTVSIAGDPFRLKVLRGGEVVVESAPGGQSAFSRKGEEYSLNKIVNCTELAEGISLKVETTAPGLSAEVVLTFFDDNMLVRWSLSDENPCSAMQESFLLSAGGHWYGGNVTSGHNWPLETAQTELNPFLATSNQTTPVWLTSSGSGFFVPTYQPMGFSIGKEGDKLFRFNIKDTAVMEYRLIIGADIVQVYDTYVNLVGRPRAIPPEGYFSKPIFNTWIEFKVDVNQAGLLEYAGTLREKGFPCEVFMIDDMWQKAYGDHAFNEKKFPAPKAMVDRMHGMGFKVILWVVPFIQLDSDSYSLLKKRGHLVLDAKGKKPCRVWWWNGEASLIDLSNPEAFGWFVGELKGLQAKYGIDGFKLDGGDAEYFKPEFKTFGHIGPNRYTDLFAEVGSYFAINEYRVSWLTQPLGLVQRLRDKKNNWGIRSGLGSLIPHGLTESLIGYSYFCPDIIGGGEVGDFMDKRFKGMDPELFIRWTQASALMPMMQFSFAPWHLDQESLAICLKYAKLHEQLGDYIYKLALEARQTGRPIAKPLFFRDSGDEKTYTIADQFLLGDRLLVAPVLEKGARQRDIYLPAGLWKDFWSGDIYHGGQDIENYPAPLDKLPIFVCIE
jgi:myogenesis-regulating glycosidase